MIIDILVAWLAKFNFLLFEAVLIIFIILIIRIDTLLNNKIRPKPRPNIANYERTQGNLKNSNWKLSFRAWIPKARAHNGTETWQEEIY